jgi:carboxylate-amine ligase
MAATQEQSLPAGAAEYDPGRGYDEAFASAGTPRPHYADLLAALAGTDLPKLEELVTAQVCDSGVTFGNGERFLIDPVPRLITAAEWRELETGLDQRVRALDAFVADVYGARWIVQAGVLPERVLDGIGFLEPDMRDVPRPPGAWVAIAGLDVVRDADGHFRVLEDNVRTPSGMAYALAARRAIAEHVPYAGRRRDIAAELATYLRAVIAASRPDPDADGISVLLTEGPKNSAFFEHGELAELSEVKLVRPHELVHAGDRLALLDGRRVQVVYRRTDADVLRTPSGELTPIGDLLLGPLRAGTISVVNAFGTGVADDKRVYPYVDDMVRFYLREEPIVRSVPTYDLGDRTTRDEVLERLDELVVKPRDGYGGTGVVIGRCASATQLREAREAILDAPHAFVAQETVQLSSHPTLIDGRLVPRHVDVRPFVFYDGRRARALPGGLTRVALEEGEMVVNSSRGGGGKDTWVLPS